MKEKFLVAYMDMAKRFAELSTARRLKVGAIIVKEDRVISIGYNGMPSGWDNNCEIEDWPDWMEDRDQLDPAYLRLRSKPEVLHAEANAITKVARSSESCENAAIFCTHTPCIECAKLIYQSGITEVYIGEDYAARKGCGEDFLMKTGIKIEKIA
jgi:dCMP deaminase